MRQIFAEHESAFRRLPLKPGAENHIIDAESGVVSRATVWLHGDIWFFDHYDRDHPNYIREYEHAARRSETYWRPLMRPKGL